MEVEDQPNPLFGLSISYGIQSKDLIPGKEYSFQNRSWPDNHLTGIGTVKECFESNLLGTQVVFHKVRLLYTLNWNIPIDPHWELALPLSEIQMGVTEKQYAKDLLELAEPLLPLEVIDLIFQMLDFQDLEKLKDRVDFMKGYTIRW